MRLFGGVCLQKSSGNALLELSRAPVNAGRFHSLSLCRVCPGMKAMLNRQTDSSIEVAEENEFFAIRYLMEYGRKGVIEFVLDVLICSERWCICADNADRS